jgi:Skp family chaperone for outer membrane proteins
LIIYLLIGITIAPFGAEVDVGALGAGTVKEQLAQAQAELVSELDSREKQHDRELEERWTKEIQGAEARILAEQQRQQELENERRQAEQRKQEERIAKEVEEKVREERKKQEEEERKRKRVALPFLFFRTRLKLIEKGGGGVVVGGQGGHRDEVR